PLASDGDGRLSAEFTIDRDDVTLWSPESPRLYDVEVTYGEDAITDRVGLREIDVQGSDVLVNGETVWLRGIALHEEAAGKGRALDTEDVQTRFQWINELGCNFARLAHYPHTEEMARTADEEGILLWEEVPAYWDINFGDEEIQELYRQQLRELIQRDWNRASVALWSIANETDHNDETRNEVLPEMADYVRDLDDTRLVTAACFVDETDDGIVLQDPLEEHLDVVGVNEYYGWYYGDADDLQGLQEESDGTPIVISETGGGAKWGNHGSEEDRWTEEFQAEIYRGQIEGASTNDQIAGMSPWILFDFRAPMRQNEYQRGYNRKGVVDQHGRKKQAFHVLREFYESEEL
ncbi:glycoside hydrolase family 2 TIM barrel-domain containing protein, partial [Natronoarchaeum mannanilyticum]